MLDGQGMTVPSELRRWLWAPGYPALMSLHGALGDMQAIRWTQILLFVPMLLAGSSLGRAVGGRAAALAAAWCLALSPTLVFFSGRVWSETVYVTLLLGALSALQWSLRGSKARSLVPGLLVGLCILLRGVAAPLLPLFALARLSVDRCWKSAAVLLLSGALTVGPYSVYATATFGGPVLSDRTMGQMMWLGNNDFPPVSFDHGIGPLTPGEWERVVATGRLHCDGSLSPVDWDDCERSRGWGWIRDNPGEFLARIPLREAQLLNPNSFLTRAIRRGEWRGLPVWAEEFLCVTTILWSVLAVIGGLIGIFSRGKGHFAALCIAIVAYHAVAVGLVAGLSRYRVPLDAIGLIWAGVWLASLPGTLGALRNWRGLCLGAVLLVLVPLMLHFLLSGFF